MLTEEEFQRSVLKYLKSFDKRLSSLESLLELYLQDDIKVDDLDELEENINNTNDNTNKPISFPPIEYKKGELNRTSPLSLENIKKYFDYMIENSSDDKAIGYKKIATEIGIRQGEGLRIFKKLLELNYLEKTNSRTTLIKKKELNIDEFSSVI